MTFALDWEAICECDELFFFFFFDVQLHMNVAQHSASGKSSLECSPTSTFSFSFLFPSLSVCLCFFFFAPLRLHLIFNVIEKKQNTHTTCCCEETLGESIPRAVVPFVRFRITFHSSHALISLASYSD